MSSRLATLVAVGALLVLAGCAGAESSPDRSPATAAGPVDAAGPVTSETTTIALVGPDDAATRTVADALTDDSTDLHWDPALTDPQARVDAAITAEADLIVVVGADALDAVDRESAQRLDQRFLILGAQLPEPTENVTAVIWSGADARWSVDAADRDALVSGLPAALSAGMTADPGAVIDLG